MFFFFVDSVLFESDLNDGFFYLDDYSDIEEFYELGFFFNLIDLVSFFINFQMLFGKSVVGKIVLWFKVVFQFDFGN